MALIEIKHTADGYRYGSIVTETAAEMLERLHDGGIAVPPSALAALRGEAWADREVDALPEGVMPAGPWRGTSSDALPLVDDIRDDEEDWNDLAICANGAARARWDELVQSAEEMASRN